MLILPAYELNIFLILRHTLLIKFVSIEKLIPNYPSSDKLNWFSA